MNSAKKFPKLFIYFKLVRPFTLIAPSIGFLSGTIIASRALPDSICLLGALSAAVLNAGSNVINQFYDLKIDKINKPFRPFPAGEITGKKMVIFSIILYIAALSIAAFINIKLFSLILIAALVSFFYSAPPLRLKQYPFISNVAIAFIRGQLLIVAGWCIFKPVFCAEPWFIGLIFALYLSGAATTKDFSDIEGDRFYGIRTLPVLYGAQKASRMISPFFYLPFLLIPFGAFAGIIRPTALPLSILTIWGIYTARLISESPRKLTLEKNHISWVHMYFMLILGQIGFAIAYLVEN